MKLFIKSIICTALLATAAAQAHYLWIESGDSGARLFYGEAEALLKEKSPGKLDSIKAPQAFAQEIQGGKTSAVAVSRTADYFTLGASRAAPAVLAVEESLEVRDLSKHGLGIAKSNYYARFGEARGGAASLVLDVQERGANTFAVLYRGQALKGAKLEVIAPNTWMQEHTTDAQGVAHIHTPWRGQYVIHVLHVDKTAGEFAGKKYDNLRNHFTYTFIKAEGADPGPAAAPRHPAE
jgi:uncharacterized GH25 family protein